MRAQALVFLPLALERLAFPRLHAEGKLFVGALRVYSPRSVVKSAPRRVSALSAIPEKLLQKLR